MANVQCLYDSPLTDIHSDTTTSSSDRTAVSVGIESGLCDHTYDGEPPAFIIKQVNIANAPQQMDQCVQTYPQSYAGFTTKTYDQDLPPNVSVIHVGETNSRTHLEQALSSAIQNNAIQAADYGSNNKRIRRSEVILKQAADCVSRGLTFQTVSEQFNIPISTIRFFMARKGILPRRRRGRSTHVTSCSSPDLEPPYHMQHYKLPKIVALKSDGDDDSPERKTSPPR